MAAAVANDATALGARFGTIKRQAAYSTFIRKLRVCDTDIPAAAVIPLIAALALEAKTFPREPNSLFTDWTIMQAAVLTSHLAQRLPTPDEQFAAVRLAVLKSTSFVYSVNMLQWTRLYQEKGETHGFLEEGKIKELTAIIIAKLTAEAGDVPLYRFLDSDTNRVLLPWSWYGDSDALKVNIGASVVKEGPDGAEALIQACVGKSWEMTSGIPHVGDVRRDAYRTIIRFADPELILATLRRRYGAKLDAPEFHPDRDAPLGERLALQFAYVHQQPDSTTTTDDNEVDEEERGDAA